MMRPVPFRQYPCDQIAADAFEAQAHFLKKHGAVCQLELEMIERIVSESEALYRSGSENPFETALEMNEPYRSDWERGCYERAARKIIGRRIGYRKAKNIPSEWKLDLPFAPR